MVDLTAKVAGWRVSRLGVPTGNPGRRRRALRIAAFAVPAAAVAIFAAVVGLRGGFYDIEIYHQAINHWTRGGDLYAYSLGSRSGRRYGFTYPPFAALTMLPMALIPLWAAIVVSVTATAAATVGVLYWLVGPMAHRHGWDRWLLVAAAGTLMLAFDPWGSTLGFGQVNMLLVFLVAMDFMLLVRAGRSGAGALIGLATAVKLTPGIFIVYLIVTRKWRAAAMASATTGGATLFAAVVAPGASRDFWTDALWHPERVGSAAQLSNQSLHGLVARLNPDQPSTLLWLLLAVSVLAVWGARVRAAAIAHDEMAGFALTGAVSCLISPFTWVHHLVWLIPALVLLIGNGYAQSTREGRPRWWLWLAWLTYALLCSRLIWLLGTHYAGWGVLSGNLYVVLSVFLLIRVPIRRPERLAMRTAPQVRSVAQRRYVVEHIDATG